MVFGSTLEAVGVIVLEGEGTIVAVDGVRVGIAGTKGFGGGFAGACGSEFGEEEMKTFMRYARVRAEQLTLALAWLNCDVRIALTHYSPVKGTLAGERLEIYPFLGSYLLGEAVDKTGCVVAFHGHAHAGSERAVTAAGVPVRNVARPVIKHAYKVYTLSAAARAGGIGEPRSRGLSESDARRSSWTMGGAPHDRLPVRETCGAPTSPLVGSAECKARTGPCTPTRRRREAKPTKSLTGAPLEQPCPVRIPRVVGSAFDGFPSWPPEAPDRAFRALGTRPAKFAPLRSRQRFERRTTR